MEPLKDYAMFAFQLLYSLEAELGLARLDLGTCPEKETDRPQPLALLEGHGVPIRLVDLAPRTVHGTDCVIAVTLNLGGTCGVKVTPVWSKKRLKKVGGDSEGTSQKA